jgi:hypothetical protein
LATGEQSGTADADQFLADGMDPVAGRKKT